MVNNDRCGTKMGQGKDYWYLWRRPDKWNLTVFRELIQKTPLKWKSEPADQKDTLQTEIGKEESASTHIPIVTEEKLFSHSYKSKSHLQERKLVWSQTFPQQSAILEGQSQQSSHKRTYEPRIVV